MRSKVIEEADVVTCVVVRDPGDEAVAALEQPGAGAVMLAIRVNEFGGPDVLRVEEVDIPRPGQDEVLVRVMAAGVGPWDVSLRQGGYPGPFPYIPGGEFAGVVEGDTGSFASFYEGAPVYGYPGLTGVMPST